MQTDEAYFDGLNDTELMRHTSLVHPLEVARPVPPAVAARWAALQERVNTAQPQPPSNTDRRMGR